MSTRAYRITVVGSMLTWFLLGLHAPLVHEIVDHGRAPRPSLLAAVALIAAVALAGLWTLLRAPRHGLR